MSGVSWSPPRTAHELARDISAWASLSGASAVHRPSEKLLASMGAELAGLLRAGTPTSTLPDFVEALEGLSTLCYAPCYAPAATLLGEYVAWFSAALPALTADESQRVMGALIWMGHRPVGEVALAELALALALAQVASPLAVEAWGMLKRAPPAATVAAAEARALGAARGHQQCHGLVQLLNGLASSRTPISPALAHAVEAVLGDASALGELRPRELVNAMWALARLELQPAASTMAALDRAVQAVLVGLSSSELACCLWSLGSLPDAGAGVPEGSVLRLADALFSQAGTSDPGDLIEALMGMTRMRCYGPSRLDHAVDGALETHMAAIEDALAARLSSIEPADLAHLLWCWAMLAYEPRAELVRAVEAAAGSASDRMSGRSAAAALWALADRRTVRRCSFRASDECVESLQRAVHRASADLTDKDCSADLTHKDWEKVHWANRWLARQKSEDEDESWLVHAVYH